MSNHFNAANHTAGDDSTQSCWNWLHALQVAVGLLLLAASAFGYSLFQQPIVMVPAMMGGTLVFYGATATLVCRDHGIFHDHHPTNGMLG